MKDTIEVSGSHEQARANVVKERLKQIQNTSDDGFFETCELLLEAQEYAYHTQWGFSKFGDWVELASGLDMSARQAYYYISIASKAIQLDLTRDELKKARISKLKEIFSLNPDEYGDEMKDLVERAPGMSLDEVKAEVRALRGGTEADEMVYMTIKVQKSIKEIIDEAFELAKMNFGDQIVGGEPVEPTDTKCLELICQSYVQDVNNHPEGVE